MTSSANAEAGSRRVAVIGAGPLGLVAALRARERGFDVTVFEKGQVGDAMRRWGRVRMFTPLAMNLPVGARELVGSALPPEDALLTGPEMAATVLQPLADSPVLQGRVLTGHRVLAVGRAGLLRSDLPGHPLRFERPFRLLVRGPQGDRYHEADAVLDASGVYDRPNPLGLGGLPACGETALGGGLIRYLGELDDRLSGLAGRRVLLIGHGHSAANALLMLQGLVADSPATHVTWATRSAHRRPCEEVAGDPLPQRRRIASRANDLAQDPPGFLAVRRRTSVEALRRVEGRLAVTFTVGGRETFDAVVAMTGYRPDLSFLSELAIETSPVTQGGARLARALADLRDCLAIPEVSPADLDSGEPGFHLIGSKAYGRARSFLIKTGLAQLDMIMERL